MVSSYWGVGAGTIFSEVEETAGSGRDGVAVLQVGGFYGCVLFPDTVLLIFEEEGDVPGLEEYAVQGFLWNDTVIVMEF